MDKETLYNLYIEKNITAKEIAISCGVDVSSVFNWLKKYGIKKPKRLKNSNISSKLQLTNCDETKRNAIVEKRKNTCLEKYGVDNPGKSEEVKEKIKNTNMQRYGETNPSKSSQIKEKIRKNNMRKYGVEWVRQLPEIVQKGKDSCIQKYGVDNPTKCKEIKEKIKKTSLERYGVDNPSKSEEVKEKINNVARVKYGVKYMVLLKQARQAAISKEAQQKKYETKKKNHTFNSSSVESFILDKLKLKFPDTVSQYKSDEYPFTCDFYIPCLDLYIEYNEMWTHGNEPFDSENINHQKRLKKMQDKAITSKFYRNAIYVWTDLDVRKRQTAKTNNLNFLEFFNVQQFNYWYESL